MQFSKEEREQIIRTLRVLCEARAHFWDALRAVEDARGNVELETDSNDLEGILAAELGQPPTASALSDDDVWEAFLDEVAVRFSTRRDTLEEAR
jgi:hypothetical protein